MANNYVEASFAIDKLTDAEIAWWQKEGERYKYDQDDLDQPSPEEMDPPYSNDWALEPDNKLVWFHGDESTDVDVAAEVIHRFLKECSPNGSVGFTWAETCSKPRLDEFGGGACFITAKEIKWNSAYGWLQEQVQLFHRDSCV